MLIAVIEAVSSSLIASFVKVLKSTTTSPWSPVISTSADTTVTTVFAVGLGEGLLSNPLRNGVGEGLFDGVGVTVAAADELGVGDTVGVTEGVALTDGVTLGVGVVLGVGVTEGLGVGVKKRPKTLLAPASSGVTMLDEPGRFCALNSFNTSFVSPDIFSAFFCMPGVRNPPRPPKALADEIRRRAAMNETTRRPIADDGMVGW